LLAITVGQQHMCRLKGRYRQQAGSYRGLVYKSGMSVRNKEGQRGPPKSQVGYQAASRAVDLAFDFDLLAPWGGRVEVLRSGPTEQDRREGMPSLGEAPDERGKSARLLTAGPRRLLQVTRRKGETISSRYRSNGYGLKSTTPSLNSPPNPTSRNN